MSLERSFPHARPPAAINLAGIAAVVVTLVVLRMTRDVTMPIAAGLLLAALVWPVLRRLERFLPRALALLGSVLLVIALVIGLVAGLGWGARNISDSIVDRRSKVERIHRDANTAVSQFGIRLPPLPGTTGDSGSSDEAAGGQSRGTRNGLAMRVGTAVFSGIAILGLTIGFMALALAESRGVRSRIRRRFTGERAERMVGIAGEVASRMQRYFVVKSVTSGITGMSTLLIALAFGLDFAAIWGLLAFLLEYVPTVGSVIAVIPPALYAAVQFEGLARPLAFTACLTVMQLVLGNYVDPRIEGKLLAISPFVVLASIVLWAWVWGAPGALLGVPLTVATATVSRHFAASHWIWALLTEADDDEPPEDRRVSEPRPARRPP